VDYRLLLDAPGEPKSRLQIAVLGDYKHGRHGDISITEQDIEAWRANLDRLPGKRALIDLDHRSDRAPRNSEAAGWITNVDMTDGVPMADVEWTPVGRTAIEEKRYLFFSPSYGRHKTAAGETIENVLTGGALTNKPFLESMPTITLAAPERMSEAYEELYEGKIQLGVPQAERDLAVKEHNALPDGSYPIRNTAQLHSAAILAASGHGNVQAARKLIQRRAKELGVDVSSLPGFSSDSPAKKMEAELLTLLELPEDADDAKALEAVTALKAKVTELEAEKPEVKTLDQLLKEEGKVALDSAQLVQLTADASAGREAKNELEAQKFENAFDLAVREGKAIPVMKESKQHFYTLDAEATLKELAEGPVIVNVKPSGWDNTSLTEAEVTDPNKALDQAIWKHIEDNKLPQSDYPKVLDQMMKGEL
jgi:phage I-like protein